MRPACLAKVKSLCADAPQVGGLTAYPGTFGRFVE
jgi:hypothetical protein